MTNLKIPAAATDIADNGNQYDYSGHRLIVGKDQYDDCRD